MEYDLKFQNIYFPANKYIINITLQISNILIKELGVVSRSWFVDGSWLVVRRGWGMVG